MYDTLCVGALYAVSINVAHNVVTDELFALDCYVIVDIVLVSLELVNLLLSNRQTELHFSFRKSNPKSSPRPELHIRREDILHFLTRIT